MKRVQERSAVVVPDERPAPPVDASQLDRLLDGLLSAPVTLDDLEQVHAAVLDLWPGCKAEVHCHDRGKSPCALWVIAWWGSHATGARILRSVVVR